MSANKLRESRNIPTVIFTEFTRSYKRHRDYSLYCFFEGKDDNKYYGIRIRTIVKNENLQPFTCNGKEGVLGIYRMISSRKYYSNVRAIYFVDRDFDESINQGGASAIYETPCHSVENFYTSVQCFSRIIRDEFQLQGLDENFNRCIDLYTKLQKEFHNAVELLNVWIACHRDKSSQLNLSNHKLSDFVSIDLDQVIAQYTLSDLRDKFPDVPIILESEIDAKRSELLTRTQQKSFRGKYEIEFLYTILDKLRNEANRGTYPYFQGKVKVVLSLSRATIISDLSQYADTPECLYTYLEPYIY